MALRYSESAPTGWLIDENNRMVKVTAAEYASAKNSQTAQAPVAAPAPVPTAPAPAVSSGFATIYRGSDTMTVPAGDVSYWTGQGWGSSKPAAPAPAASAPAVPSTSGLQFYRVGTDIYESGTNRKIGPTEWNRDWSGKAAEVAAPKAETSQVQVGDYSKLPKSLTDSDTWKNLTEEQKKAVALTYAGLISGSDAAKDDANKALEDAKRLADPYYKGLISLAQDELQRNVTSTKADAASQVKTLQDKIDQIGQDLAFSREDLTIEERSDLASIKRQYEIQLQDTQDKMVESGLAFSSPRAEAERRLTETSQETATSTSRKFARQKREAELAAQRGVAAAAQGITDTQRKSQESITASERTAEQKLGTSNLPQGTSGLGTPITGTIEQQRQTGILDLEKTILNRSTPLPF